MRKHISSIFVLSAAALLTAFSACNKLSKSTAIAPSSDSVITKSNVVVVDTTSYTLVSTAAQLKDGIYVYIYAPSLPVIRHNGDFAEGVTIIGITGQGYLRKITSVDAQAESITLTTTQGRLEDVFQDGDINFTTGYRTVGGASDGFNPTYTNKTVFGNADVVLKVDSGGLFLNSDWVYNLQFRNGITTRFATNTIEGNMSAKMKLNITSSAASTFNATDTLSKVTSTVFKWIGKIPLLITTDLYVIGQVAGSTSGPSNNTIIFSNNTSIEGNASYATGMWSSNFHINPSSTLNGKVAGGGNSMGAVFNIIPIMSVKFYGAVASSVTFPINNNMTGNVSATSADWDFTSHYLLQSNVKINSSIIGYSVTDYGAITNNDSLNYNTPYQVAKLSGDFQIGAYGQYLTQPIVIRVVDNKGNPQAGVPVYFRVTAGGGNLSYSMILSDANGRASGYWQLGNFSGHQTVEVTVKKANGSQVPGSPAIFTAN